MKQSFAALVAAVAFLSPGRVAADACTADYLFADEMEQELLGGTYEGMLTFSCGGSYPPVAPAPFALILPDQASGSTHIVGTARARGVTVDAQISRYCLASFRVDGSMVSGIADWRGDQISYSYGGVQGRLTGTGGAASMSPRHFAGHGYNGMSVNPQGIAGGCSANVGPASHLDLARAEEVSVNYIVAVDGGDCGVPGTRALYYRNLHPDHRLAFHVEHHWVYENVEYREYLRFEAEPNGSAGPAATSRDVRMGCPIPGPTMQQFHWDVTHAFRIL